MIAYDEACDLVVAEIRRQRKKWGEQNHDPCTYLTILMEEVGELAKEAVEDRFRPTGETRKKMLDEAVQTAAVALSIVECLIRGTWQWPRCSQDGETAHEGGD